MLNVHAKWCVVLLLNRVKHSPKFWSGWERCFARLSMASLSLLFMTILSLVIHDSIVISIAKEAFIKSIVYFFCKTACKRFSKASRASALTGPMAYQACVHCCKLRLGC